jgi:hypothetical protein
MELIPISRWITPLRHPRRFDTSFFVLPIPFNQEPLHDVHETVDGFWFTSRRVMDSYFQGHLKVVSPTLRILEISSRLASVHALCRLAAHQSLIPVCPELVYEGSNVHLALPGDLSHSIRTRQVLGPTRFVYQNRRFVSDLDSSACWLPTGLHD